MIDVNVSGYQSIKIPETWLLRVVQNRAVPSVIENLRKSPAVKKRPGDVYGITSYFRGKPTPHFCTKIPDAKTTNRTGKGGGDEKLDSHLATVFPSVSWFSQRQIWSHKLREHPNHWGFWPAQNSPGIFQSRPNYAQGPTIPRFGDFQGMFGDHHLN